MFSDGRSKKVVFLSHCLLNQNAISDGTAVYPAAFDEVISCFLEAHIGISQLPCPELLCLGLDRGDEHGADRPVTVENTRIRRAMAEPFPRQLLAELAELTVQQVLDYRHHGFTVVGIVGANRSPNCGVETTSDHDQEIDGRGIFMAELEARLAREGIVLPMIGLKGSDNIREKLSPLLNA